MKQLLTLLASSLLLISSIGFSQELQTTSNQATRAPEPPAPTKDYDVGEEGASLTQEVNINIPQRLALHLHETEINLDLENLSAFNYNTQPGALGCYLVARSLQGDVTDLQSLYAAIWKTKMAVRQATNSRKGNITAYPAVVLNGESIIQDEHLDYLKGGLVCVFETVVQKFSNVGGWEFTADIQMTDNLGKFGIVDDVRSWIDQANDGEADGIYSTKQGLSFTNLSYLLDGSAEDLTLAKSDEITGAHNYGDNWGGDPNRFYGGFLNDYVLQFYYFDGTETPGDGGITITYNIAPSL